MEVINIKFNYEIAEPLMNKNRNRDYNFATKKMMEENLFLIPPFGRITIEIENNFKTEKASRSLNRMIHSHSFLADLYTSYTATKNKEIVKYAEYIINEWLDFKDMNSDNDMLFHDETTAQRMLYWMNFYYICSDEFSQIFSTRFIKEIEDTAKLLLTDDFHTTNTNHGMFQDISLLSYSLLNYEQPKNSIEYQTAISRLSNYFKNIYTLDGVHKEHSPDYHFMVTLNVKKIADVVQKLSGQNNEDEDYLRNIYFKAEKYATHIIQPNLYLPNISDCSGFNINEKSMYANLFTSNEFNFVKTAGEKGNAPKETQVLFKDSGYFISRTGWTKSDTYFLFLASYHAGYHKHTDDLSFILYKNGEIFTDSGPNGYDYDSEFTKYAYSSHAHSNLVVNNESLPRHDGKFELVGIEKAEFDENGRFKVKGFNKRYLHTEHFRTISGDHNTEEYEIIDEIISDHRNEYTINFQLSNTIETIVNENIISLYRDQKKISEIEVSFENISGNPLIKSIEGQKYPYYQGFEFPNMGEELSSPTISIQFYNKDKNVKMKSKIRFSNFKINSPIISNENSFGNSNIKYTFYEPEVKNSKLLVVFSAMMPKYDYKYNYYNTLKDFNSYQLYIKDDAGEYGNYYIASNKNPEVQTNIVSLIFNIIRKYNIPLENVTLIGSSKGGFAALYYGLKYGFRNIIAGAPQTLLGNFVLDEAPHNNVAKVISGGEEEGDKLYLNNVLYDLEFFSHEFPNYFICVGSTDHHLDGHIKPFINHLNNLGKKIDFKIIPNSNHNDLKLFFKDYLYESLNNIYETNLDYNKEYMNRFTSSELIDYKIEAIGKENIRLDLNITGKNYNIVYYILDNKNNILFKSTPQKSSELTYATKDLIGKRIKLFIRNSDISKNYISPIIRDVNLITFNNSN